MATVVMINTVPRDFHHHMAPYIRSLRADGNRVVLVSAGDMTGLDELGVDERDYYNIEIVRKPNIRADFSALSKLVKLLKNVRPDVVHTIAPKSGLLGAIAGFITRCPVRIHTFTGQVWVTKSGPFRWLLMLFDKLVCTLCTFTLADSPGQRKFLVDCGIASANKIGVLGHGSVCGVNVERFRRNAEMRAQLRKEFGFDDGDVVFLHMGRINRDKGVHNLLEAFKSLGGASRRAWLIFVGPCEDSELYDLLHNAGPDVVYREYTTKPETFYWLADVLCLPSYREGFGNVIIEAAAASVPCMASNIYGVSDAVEDEQSGILHTPGDVEGMRKCFTFWLDSPDLIRTMGEFARERAVEFFSPSLLVVEFYNLYESFGVPVRPKVDHGTET